MPVITFRKTSLATLQNLDLISSINEKVLFLMWKNKTMLRIRLYNADINNNTHVDCLPQILKEFSLNSATTFGFTLISFWIFNFSTIQRLRYLFFKVRAKKLYDLRPSVWIDQKLLNPTWKKMYFQSSRVIMTAVLLYPG